MSKTHKRNYNRLITSEVTSWLRFTVKIFMNLWFLDLISPVMGVDRKMLWLKARQLSSMLLNIMTANIATQSMIRGTLFQRVKKHLVGITWPPLSRTQSRISWRWKNPGLGSGKKEYSIQTHWGSNNPLVAFAMSNESQLRSLIRSSKEAEIKIKGKGYMRHTCPWGKVKNKLCGTA